MDRRTFLQTTASLAGGLAIGTSAESLALAQSRVATHPAWDVIVVGAGVFGLWTAYKLQRKGVPVLLIDTAGAGNSLSGSGGDSRLIQTDTEGVDYVRGVISSYVDWLEAEKNSGEQFVYPMDRLRLQLDPKELDRAKERQTFLRSLGVTNNEILDKAEVQRRWPQIRADDIAFAFYSGVGSGATSTILAAKACQAVAKLFEDAGGEQLMATVRPPSKTAGRLEMLTLDDGQTLIAKRYVFACGGGMPSMFPELLGNRIRVDKREVFFYAVPHADQTLAYPNMPAWAVYPSDPVRHIYGFPAIGGEGFKGAAEHGPETVSDLQGEMNKFIYDRFPSLAGARLRKIRKCHIDQTIDGDFIVDRHPTASNVYLVGGGSGHGFKNGPIVGEEASKLVMGQPLSSPYDRIWKLDPRTFSAKEMSVSVPVG